MPAASAYAATLGGGSLSTRGRITFSNAETTSPVAGLYVARFFAGEISRARIFPQAHPAQLNSPHQNELDWVKLKLRRSRGRERRCICRRSTTASARIESNP